MSDIFTKAKRSDVMSRIKSRGNRDTEVALARVFRGLGIKEWRRQRRLQFQVSSVKFQVVPDFVFQKLKLAVFVDGCFWHACPLHATKPKGNAAFWRKKLSGNQARDRLVNRTLRRNGWRVLRIWEHELALKRRGRLEAKLGKEVCRQ
ncbi:MAG TPA: very short patch repair endonuclease [Roseimicrobium sp.]|nr:very short patch repair endonuclease [Roseimicrobium sp.]